MLLVAGLNLILSRARPESYFKSTTLARVANKGDCIMQVIRSRYYRTAQEDYHRINQNTINVVTSYHPKGLVVLGKDENGTFGLGWAELNPADIFNKQRARTVAIGRLNKRKNPVRFTISDSRSVLDAVNQLPYRLQPIAVWLIEGQIKYGAKFENAVAES